MPYRVFVLGDSMLWGQGLLPEQKFAYLAAQKLAELQGLEFSEPVYYAHSGAPLLPPGRSVQDEADARRDFANLYPELFNVFERAQFINGDEGAARELYADIPASYPTIQEQIRLVPEADALEADLLMLNGGANDADFEELLDPDNKISFEEIDRRIEQIMNVKFKLFLRRARVKFPNAVIVVPSYYSIFSSDSDRNAFRALSKFLTGSHDILGRFIVLADIAVSMPTVWLPGLVSYIFFRGKRKQKEAENKITETIQRAEFMFVRANYWQARAVEDIASNPTLRGPGILHVHPGYRPEHSAFAGGVSYLFEEYAPSKDPGKSQRMAGHPRFRFLETFVAVDESIERVIGNWGNLLGKGVSELRLLEPQLDYLNSNLRGPVRLLDALRAAFQLVTKQLTGSFISHDETKLLTSLKLLSEEIKRELAGFRLLEMASLFHPNVEGARVFAEAVTNAVAATLRPQLKNHLQKLYSQLPYSSQLTDERVLQAYGLDPEIPEDLMRFMQVHSLAIKVDTRNQSGLRSVRLFTRSGKSWRLDTPLSDFKDKGDEFRPGTTSLFTLDTYGALHLSDLAGLKLELDGDRWSPINLSLFVNGRVMFTTPRLLTLVHGDQRELDYPHPPIIVREHPSNS